MTIQQCKYAIAIAETGSFNEAAKQLFIAQSTLSLSIKALEQELEEAKKRFFISWNVSVR